MASSNAKPSEYIFLAKDKDKDKPPSIPSDNTQQKPVVQILPKSDDNAANYFGVPKQSVDPTQKISDPSRDTPKIPAFEKTEDQYEQIQGLGETLPPPEKTQSAKISPSTSKNTKKTSQELKAAETKQPSIAASKKDEKAKPWIVKLFRNLPTLKGEKDKEQSSKNKRAAPTMAPISKLDSDTDLQSMAANKKISKKSEAKNKPNTQTALDDTNELNDGVDSTQAEQTTKTACLLAAGKNQQYHHENLKNKKTLIKELFVEWNLLEKANRRSVIILIVICLSIGLLLTVADVVLWLTDFYQSKP